MINTLFLSVLLAGAGAVAPPPVPASPPPIAEKPLPQVTLTTTLGPIVVRINDKAAPVTAANFLRYVDSKRMDGFIFYRTTRTWGPASQIIQAGNRGDARLNYPPIKHEATSQTGLTHCTGALSMARAAPGTAATDFFLLLSDIKGFDADPAQPGDNAGFAVFGEVVSGLDIARKIYEAPTSPTLGDGVMKGQMLAQPVKILTARRTAPTSAAVSSCTAKAP